MATASGNIYTLATLLVGLSALVLAMMHPNLFLFKVGVFSQYIAFTGWRATMVRNGGPGASIMPDLR